MAFSADDDIVVPTMGLISEEVLRTIEVFERRLQTTVSIYDFSGSLTCHLPAERMTHRNPFCLALIQADGGKRCGQFDCFVNVPAALKRNPCDFFKRCHGDVVEYVHGLRRDGQLFGAILAGPYLWPENKPLPGTVLTARSKVRLKSSESVLRQQVPALSDIDLADLPVLVNLLASTLLFLIPASDSVRRGDHKRQWVIDDFLARRFRFPETSLGHLASVLGLSEDRARHVVSELYGRSFIEIITQKRMQHARNLLVSTNVTVTQIAEYCGYADSHHFHRIFRKYTGQTPLEHRKRGEMDSSVTENHTDLAASASKV